MPQGRWYVYPVLGKMKEFEEKTHAELFAEARRPIETITPEHLEWLYQQMEKQQRWTHGVNVIKKNWDADTEPTD